MDKKYIIRPGERVTIELNRKKLLQMSGTKVPVRRGAIKTRREQAYLARRLQGNFINFYDLGYFLSGEEYQTLDNIFQPIVEPPAPDSEILSWTIENTDLETYFDDLRADIFATPLENFTSSFFRIPKGNIDYERSIIAAWTDGGFVSGELGELPEWKSEGLKLTQAQVETLEIYPFQYIYNWDALELGAMTNLKATLTLDYEADAVEFTPGVKMDVFLMPAAIFNQVSAFYANGLMTGVDFSDLRYHFDVLNANLQILPRELIGDNMDFWASASGWNTYQQAHRLGEQMKQFPSSRAKRRIKEVDEVSDPTVYTYSTASFDKEDFPFSPVYDNPDAPTNSTYVFNNSFGYSFSLYTGSDYDRLKAVIRKNNTWYYIWNTA